MTNADDPVVRCPPAPRAPCSPDCAVCGAERYAAELMQQYRAEAAEAAAPWPLFSELMSYIQDNHTLGCGEVLYRMDRERYQQLRLEVGLLWHNAIQTETGFTINVVTVSGMAHWCIEPI